MGSGILYETGSNKWSNWDECDATCTKGEVVKRKDKNQGYERRRTTCVHVGAWNGTSCEYTSDKPTAINCNGMDNMTFPGLFGPWSSWDASSCGNSPSSHKIRVQTTCTRPKVNAA